MTDRLKIMNLLFPGGITPEQYSIALDCLDLANRTDAPAAKTRGRPKGSTKAKDKTITDASKIKPFKAKKASKAASKPASDGSTMTAPEVSEYLGLGKQAVYAQFYKDRLGWEKTDEGGRFDREKVEAYKVTQDARDADTDEDEGGDE